MTFRPANPSEPPQAAQTPIDPAESAIESIGESVEQARENVQAAREDALEQAQSQSERDAINARFDAMQESVGQMANRIESAITTGNAQLAATLTGFLDRLDAKIGQGAATGDESDDDEILSIEEIADSVTEPVAGAAAAVADTVEQVADEAPRRVHGFLRPLWGGRKD